MGAVHERLAQGFVIDTRLDGDTRLVTFANGLTVRELFIDIDNEDRSRLVWITDVLSNDLAGLIGALVEQGTEAIK